MSGRASRSKGIRNELRLRDSFRKEGYESRRIPLSGSMEGYKGDVQFGIGLEPWLTAEVKSRKCSYSSIYTEVYRAPNHTLYLVLPNGTLAIVSAWLAPTISSARSVFLPDNPIAKRIQTLHKVLGHADILVIKDDRQDFLYIKYL